MAHGVDIDDVCTMLVKRVVNQFGPQTTDSYRDANSQHLPQTATTGYVAQTTEYPLHTAINERLSSMETHARLSAGQSSRYVFSFNKICFSCVDTFCFSSVVILNTVSTKQFFCRFF